MHTIVFRFRAALLAHHPERRKIHDVPSTNDSRDVVVVLASATRHAYVLYSRTSLNDTASAEMARRQLRDHIEGGAEGGREQRGARGQKGAWGQRGARGDGQNTRGQTSTSQIEEEGARGERSRMKRPRSNRARTCPARPQRRRIRRSYHSTTAPTPPPRRRDGDGQWREGERGVMLRGTHAILRRRSASSDTDLGHGHGPDHLSRLWYSARPQRAHAYTPHAQCCRKRSPHVTTSESS